MKHLRLDFFIILFVVLTFKTAWANEKETTIPETENTPEIQEIQEAEEEQEAQGEFVTNIGLYLFSEMNEDVGQDSTISGYDEKESDHNSFIMPSLEFSYLIEEWSFSSDLLNLQVDRETSFGEFTFGLYLPTFEVFSFIAESEYIDPTDAKEKEAYKNPYQLNQERETTMVYNGEFSFHYYSPGDLQFQIGYERNEFEYEQDLTEKLYEKLGRSGTRDALILALDYEILTVQYELIRLETEGEADSASGNAYQVDLLLPYEALGLYCNLSASQTNLQYNETHPVFNKTRSEKTTNLSMTVSYRMNSDRLIADSDMSINALLTQSETSSNITFFDSKSTSIGIGGQITF